MSKLPERPEISRFVITVLALLSACGEPEERLPATNSPGLKPNNLPLEFTPLPEGLSAEEIDWPSDESSYAYRTETDEEALTTIDEVFGLRIDSSEARIVHSASKPLIYEYGMRLEPNKAGTILDELHASFFEANAQPGSRFEGWAVKDGSEPWGEHTLFKGPMVRDGLTFENYKYIWFAHPRYMSDQEENPFLRDMVIFAVVDLDDGDFYVTLSDWGDD